MGFAVLQYLYPQLEEFARSESTDFIRSNHDPPDFCADDGPPDFNLLIFFEDLHPWFAANFPNIYINHLGITDKTMDDKLSLIPNDDKQNCPFCRLKSLVENFEPYFYYVTQIKFDRSFI